MVGEDNRTESLSVLFWGIQDVELVSYVQGPSRKMYL